MREILFRGKRIDNGEWVEGWLNYRFHYDEKARKEILSPIIDFANDVTVFGKTVKLISTIRVNPETVGQFTGLTDKNGKKIFEGDIVKAERICNQEVWFGSVVWWNGCFAIRGAKHGNVPAIDLFRAYEIIGNIHDNPELLEGEQ